MSVDITKNQPKFNINHYEIENVMKTLKIGPLLITVETAQKKSEHG